MTDSATHLRRRTDHQPEDPTLRALVVEDNDPYRQYVAVLIRRFGFHVTSCADGAEALTILRERTFDLLVVDCEMPFVGGLELIVELRAQERHTDAYAVMLTGRDDVETKLAALRLGYDDFLLKSASELEITAKLSVARRLVSRHRRLDAAVRELHGLATRDELTGLYNRRYFFAEAERMLAEGTTINLVLLDLDDFKRINDTHGHLAGDRILRDIGSLFQRRTRHDDLVARYGGDEFVMLVQKLTPPEVEGLIGRVSNEIASVQWTIGTETIGVGVTTGFACSTLMERPSVPQLLSACDRDLYKNKWMRKNPDSDPALYAYESSRDARVVDIVTMSDEAARKLEG
ncbi:MAG TPA: diguanylate cyclase [Thermoanaerobaculia bacterium]